MKKCGLLTIVLTVLITALCLNCFASNQEAQVKALEQQASRIESQIEQAKKASQAATDNQVMALRNSVEQFIRQRVQIDAQIARLENQIDQVKSQSQSNLDRQLTHYQSALGQLQSQISGMVGQKKATPEPAAAVKAAPVTQVKAAVVPKEAAPKKK